MIFSWPFWPFQHFCHTLHTLSYSAHSDFLFFHRFFFEVYISMFLCLSIFITFPSHSIISNTPTFLTLHFLCHSITMTLCLCPFHPCHILIYFFYLSHCFNLLDPMMSWHLFHVLHSTFNKPLSLWHSATILYSIFHIQFPLSLAHFCVPYSVSLPLAHFCVPYSVPSVICSFPVILPLDKNAKFQKENPKRPKKGNWWWGQLTNMQKKWYIK